ncbi:hypothetical protein D3C71_1822260 [compost metagenome]
MLSFLVTSSFTAIAPLPSSVAAVSARAISMSQIATRAPSVRYALANSSPIPRAAPVIIAILFSSLKAICVSLYYLFGGLEDPGKVPDEMVPEEPADAFV